MAALSDFQIQQIAAISYGEGESPRKAIFTPLDSPGLSFHSEWGSSGQTNADIWINMHSHREVR